MHKLSEDESGFWFATKRMWQRDLGVLGKPRTEMLALFPSRGEIPQEISARTSAVGGWEQEGRLGTPLAPPAPHRALPQPKGRSREAGGQCAVPLPA